MKCGIGTIKMNGTLVWNIQGSGISSVELLSQSRRDTHPACTTSRQDTVARRITVCSHIMKKYLGKNHWHPCYRVCLGPRRHHNHLPSHHHKEAPANTMKKMRHAGPNQIRNGGFAKPFLASIRRSEENGQGRSDDEVAGKECS